MNEKAIAENNRGEKNNDEGKNSNLKLIKTQGSQCQLSTYLGYTFCGMHITDIGLIVAAVNEFARTFRLVKYSRVNLMLNGVLLFILFDVNN